MQVISLHIIDDTLHIWKTSPSRNETRIIHDYSRTAHPLSQLTKDASNYTSRAIRNHSHRFYLAIATRRTKPRHSRQTTPHRHPNAFDERTDHTDLAYFHMKHKLSRQQACWALFYHSLTSRSTNQTLCPGEQILKRGYKTVKPKKIACFWIKISSLHKHYNRHIGKTTHPFKKTKRKHYHVTTHTLLSED